MTPIPPHPAFRFRRCTPRRLHRVYLRRPARLLVALGAVLLAGCIDPIDPDEFRIVGYIPPGVLAGGDLEPQIPDSATVRVPMQIRIWTFHWCAADAGVEVSEYGGSAVVTPYIATLQQDCTETDKPIEHSAEVVFLYSRPSEIVLRYSTVEGGTWKANGTRVYAVTVSPTG